MAPFHYLDRPIEKTETNSFLYINAFIFSALL